VHKARDPTHYIDNVPVEKMFRKPFSAEIRVSVLGVNSYLWRSEALNVFGARLSATDRP
jgi:hypothetical protein